MDRAIVNINPGGPGPLSLLNPRTAQLAWNAGQSIGRGIKRVYESYRQATPARKRSRMARSSPRGRRAARRPRRGRRYAKRTTGKRRGGRRYRSGPARVGKSLRTNFQMNDHNKIRAVQNLGEIEVKSGPLVQNNTRFVCDLDHWTTEWVDEIEKYSQFRMTDIQFVLKPRSVITSAHSVVCSTNQINHLSLRTVNPTDPPLAMQSIPKLQQTPGVRYIPLQRKARTIQNCAPMMTQLDSFVTTVGTDSFERQKTVGWIDITTDTKTLPLAAIEVTVPGMDTVTPTNLFWDVSVYATIHLRGNKTQLVAPFA